MTEKSVFVFPRIKSFDAPFGDYLVSVYLEKVTQSPCQLATYV